MARRKAESWKDRLEPFGEMQAGFDERIRNRLRTMSDDELRQILADTKKPNERNCWCHTFRVAPIVEYQAQFILQERKATSQPVIA